MNDNAAAHNDQKLLLELRTGNEQAFQLLYNSYSKPIFHNILRMVCNRETAQEILQDIFIKVWEHRESIDPILPFKSYLYKMARNQVLNYFRSEGIDRKVKDYLQSINTELYSHVEEAIHAAQQSDLLKQTIEKLPPQRRHIYQLCKLEGKSYEEVSRLLNISTGTISDHIVKANRFIREHFPINEAYGSIILSTLFFGNL